MNNIKWFDVIRVVGLLLILGYHLFYNNLTGGFLGVDMFFTLSGFLVTARVLEEIRRNEEFRVFAFYKRRFLRIFPPLFFAILFTLPFALMVPDLTVHITRQITAALGFVTNWFEIQTGGSYEAEILPSMYVHTWFLAVEMQFYLLWGLVCAFLSALKLRFSHLKMVLFSLSLVLAAGSFLFQHYSYELGGDLSAIYFNTVTRLFPFFIGSAAAVLWGLEDELEYDFDNKITPYHSPEKNKGIVVGLILAAAIIVSVIITFAIRFQFEDSYVYRHAFLITSLLTAALIFIAHALHNLTPGTVKEPFLIKKTAQLSFNIYLFHWPLYVVFSALISSNLLAATVTLALAIAFSVLVHEMPELIFRPKRGKISRKVKRFVATGLTTAAILACVTLSFLVIRNAPDMTSMERDFAAGHLYQDMEGILSLKQGVEARLTSPPPVVEEIVAIAEPIPTEEVAEYVVPMGITLIGDSVSLGGAEILAQTLPDSVINADVSRKVNHGHDTMVDLVSRGELREFVIIALGSNADYEYIEFFDRIINGLPAGHKLIMVTPFDGRSNRNARLVGETTAWMRELPNRYDFITIADWNAFVSSQPQILAADRVHLGLESSMQMYANVILEAYNTAVTRPAKP